MDKALGIEHADVFPFDAERAVETRTGHARRARAHDHHDRVLNPAARQLAGVEQRRAGNDGRAVLVVVENRDVHFLFQRLLDDEALGGLDVLKVDAAEGGLHGLHRRDEFLGAARLQTEIKNIHVREILEEDALALHDRLGRVGSDVAEAEDGGAVGNDGHEVGAARVFGHQRLILRDGLARLGHARRIGEGEVFLAFAALGQHHFRFPVTGRSMIFEGFFPRKQGHVASSF